MIEIRTAFIPRVPRSISNVTLSPSVIPSGAEVIWKKYFSPLPKSFIKPLIPQHYNLTLFISS